MLNLPVMNYHFSNRLINTVVKVTFNKVSVSDNLTRRKLATK